jgi:hypothetical protein
MVKKQAKKRRNFTDSGPGIEKFVRYVAAVAVNAWVKTPIYGLFMG